MDNLIDFSALSDVTNNFIDKISGAIGWVVTHDTPNRIAKETLIENVKNSNLDPIEKAVIISNSRKIIREHKNQASIVNIALQNLKASANPDKMDVDWIAQIMDKSRLVYDEEFQILWGNILAEECNVPGSVPKALLHIMEQLDKDMAYKFIKLVSISVWHDDGRKIMFTPIVEENISSEYYKEKGFTYDDLVDLQAIGLIQMDFIVGFTQDSINEIIDIHYFDEIFTLPEGRKKFFVGHVVYTNAGNALCKAITTEKIEGFFEKKCIPLFNKICES